MLQEHKVTEFQKMRKIYLVLEAVFWGVKNLSRSSSSTIGKIICFPLRALPEIIFGIFSEARARLKNHNPRQIRAIRVP